MEVTATCASWRLTKGEDYREDDEGEFDSEALMTTKYNNLLLYTFDGTISLAKMPS